MGVDNPTKRRRRRSRPPLDERHYRAIAMLNAVPREEINIIAHRLGVHRTTLWRWTQRNDFKALHARYVGEMAREDIKAIRQRLSAEIGRGNMRSIAWFIDRL